MTKIYLGADHAGFQLKEFLKKKLQEEKYKLEDVGAFKFEDHDDYPDYVKKLVLKIKRNPRSFGVLICGTGAGVCMAANRYKHIRATNCSNVDLAYWTRRHNNANVLCLSGYNVGEALAWRIFKKFVETPFESGRHARRVRKMAKMG